MSDAFTSDTYDALCKEAEDYLSRGLAEQARELLLKAISLIGTRPKARSLLADCCMSLGLWSEARAQLETLTTLEVGNTSHHFRLGQVMEEMGEYALARDNYSVVLDGDPDNHAAQVALNRLKDRPDREPDKQEETGEPEEEGPRESGDVQMYPDDESEEGVFASASEDEVEKLLKDIGVAPGETESEDGTDVAELLSSMGIDLGDSSEKKKEPVKDISDILEGGSPQKAEAEGEKEQAGEEESAEEAEEGPSLDAIFGGPPAEPETAEAAEKEEEEPEEPAGEPEEKEGEEGASLEAIFGTSGSEEEEAEKKEAEAEEEAAEPEAAEEEKPTEEPETAEEEKPAAEEAGPSLAAIFGGEGPEPEETAEEPEAAEEEAAGKEAEASLTAIFGGEEPEEAAEEEPAEEEPAEEEPAEEEAAEEEAAEEEAAEEEAAEEEAAEEEPAEEEPAEEPGPSLASIFGGGKPEAGEEPSEEPEAAEEEEAGEKAGPSLASIFGGGKPEAEEEPAEEKVAEEEAPEEEEQPAGEEEAVEEAPPGEAGEAAPAAGEKPAVLCHRPAAESVAVVYLEDAEVAVATGFLVAAEGTMEAAVSDGLTTLSGSGRAWIGDGSAVPVSLGASQALRVDPDRLALRDSTVELMEADDHGLCRTGGQGTLIILAGGRFRWISCTGDEAVWIARGSLLAAEGEIELRAAGEPGEDFLLASGEGRMLISG
jgi:hypothetical protein